MYSMTVTYWKVYDMLIQTTFDYSSNRDSGKQGGGGGGKGISPPDTFRP